MKNKLPLVLTLMVLCLSACSAFPSRSSEPTVDLAATVYWLVDDAVSIKATQIMADVNNRLIQLETLQTIEPQKTATATPLSATSIPSAIKTAQSSVFVCMDKAAFVRDVTIPDKTTVPAGKPFTKIWEIRNEGSCAWDENYKLVFQDGVQLANRDKIGFPKNASVSPGGTIEISVYMTAPERSGDYESFWIFENANGVFFGTGKENDKPIWVKVTVK